MVEWDGRLDVKLHIRVGVPQGSSDARSGLSAQVRRPPPAARRPPPLPAAAAKPMHRSVSH